MMSLNVSIKIKQTALVAALICSLPLAHSWVTPVNMSVDHEGSGSRKSVTTSLGNFDRCDTMLVGYSATDPAPTQCHRQNLIWQLGSKNATSGVAETLSHWNPELGGDANWRLPTIKELSRLVDYSSYSKGKEALNDQPLILNMFAEVTLFTPSNSWLISSTYRDIDGDAANGQAQIFGINMGTGEIATFDTVISSTSQEETIGAIEILSENEGDSWGVGDEYSRAESYEEDVKVVVTKIITSTVDNGGGSYTIYGEEHTNSFPYSLKKCDSLSVDVNEEVTCNLSDTDVYALVVHINTVSELLTP
jgi:hypothetical protein